MEAESSSKNNGGGIDRMSSLPESVLLHILSFLPTKTCVATMSLVSHRWRHLWEHLDAFEFSDDEAFYCNLSKRFPIFVNAVPALRRSRHIRKMRLYCGIWDDDTYSLDTWIRAAIGPRLEELHLTIHDCQSRFLLLPLTLFNCSNLVSLRLCCAINVIVKHSSAVHFPSLKRLKLLYLNFVDGIDALLSACPILETLKILETPDSMSKFCVPPSLKKLKFTSADPDHIETKIYLQIDAPALQYLSINTTGTKFNAAVGNLQNVVEAYIDVSTKNETESVNPLLSLLRALFRIKHLVLQCYTTKCLLCAPVLDFPEFRRLLHLELSLPSFDLSFVFHVLHKCPMLQALIIKNEEEASPLRTWEESQSTRVPPNCLLSHITYIHIKGYQGSEDELAFAEYILRNGLVLKTMIISDDFSLDVNKKYCILKRLSHIPRGSVMCQLQFDSPVSP